VDQLGYQEQQLRWLLKDVQTIEARANHLYNAVRSLKINLGIKGVDARDILLHATRARGDSRLLEAWAKQIQGEIRSAGRGASMSGSRYGHATSVHGLAATLEDRSKKLAPAVSKIAQELDRLYQQTHARMNDPMRHSAGAGIGLEGFMEVLGKATDFLEMVEKFLHGKHHH
jgi:hypothetical protein